MHLLVLGQKPRRKKSSMVAADFSSILTSWSPTAAGATGRSNDLARRKAAGVLHPTRLTKGSTHTLMSAKVKVVGALAKSHPVEGDGLIPLLYHHLHKKTWNHNKELQSCPGARCPDTVVYEHNFPQHWYTFDPKHQEIQKRPGSYLDTAQILKFFSRPSAPGIDVVAQYLYASENSATDEPDLCVEFFTAESLRDFLHNRKSRPDGILQKFVVPKGERNSQIQVIWSPSVTLVYKRTSSLRMKERGAPLYDRAVTCDGPSHYTREDMLAQQTRRQVVRLCHTFVQHFQATEHKPVSRVVMYFKVDERDQIWVLWASSLRIGPSKFSSSAERSPVNLATSFVTPEDTDTICGSKQTDGAVLDRKLLESDTKQYALSADVIFAATYCSDVAASSLAGTSPRVAPPGHTSAAEQQTRGSAARGQLPALSLANIADTMWPALPGAGQIGSGGAQHPQAHLSAPGSTRSKLSVAAQQQQQTQHPAASRGPVPHRPQSARSSCSRGSQRLRFREYPKGQGAADVSAGGSAAAPGSPPTQGQPTPEPPRGGAPHHRGWQWQDFASSDRPPFLPSPRRSTAVPPVSDPSNPFHRKAVLLGICEGSRERTALTLAQQQQEGGGAGSFCTAAQAVPSGEVFLSVDGAGGDGGGVAFSRQTSLQLPGQASAPASPLMSDPDIRAQYDSLWEVEERVRAWARDELYTIYSHTLDHGVREYYYTRIPAFVWGALNTEELDDSHALSLTTALGLVQCSGEGGSHGGAAVDGGRVGDAGRGGREAVPLFCFCGYGCSARVQSEGYDKPMRKTARPIAQLEADLEATITNIFNEQRLGLEARAKAQAAHV